MKKTLVILALVMFLGTFAAAQVLSKSATLTVNATIPESLSLGLDKSIINFDVTNVNAPTTSADTTTMTITAAVSNIHSVKGFMTFAGLTGIKSGKLIPADRLFVQAAGVTSGFVPVTSTPISVGGGFVSTTVSSVLTFQLAAVPTFYPDTYTGDVIITVQII